MHLQIYRTIVLLINKVDGRASLFTIIYKALGWQFSVAKALGVRLNQKDKWYGLQNRPRYCRVYQTHVC